MKENQTPEVTVVIVNDSSINDCESLGFLKEKKLFSLKQIKGYLFIALTIAERDIDSINDLFKVLETVMDNVQAKEATQHLKNIIKKKEEEK